VPAHTPPRCPWLLEERRYYEQAGLAIRFRPVDAPVASAWPRTRRTPAHTIASPATGYGTSLNRAPCSRSAPGSHSSARAASAGSPG
jgi:hypothetical protein